MTVITALEWTALAGLLLTLVLGANLAANLVCFRTPPPADPPAEDMPLVSILIPARNEAGRIGPCLRSLLAQTWKRSEIIVLDDRSSDDTAGVVRRIAGDDARVRVIAGTELPAGWTGKGWACHQLAGQAAGDFLLFTDADTRHEPGAVAAAMSEVRLRRWDLYSLWPGQEMRSWSETTVVPFMLVLLLVFLPHWMPGRKRSLGAANGQFLLFRRSAYSAIGGHDSVRGHLVDDVALAREVKMRGLRLGNGEGSRWVRCRMYENFPQLWEGFSKNLRAGFEGSSFSFLVFHGVEFLWGLWPFLALVFAWMAGGFDGAGKTLAVLAGGHAVLVLLMRVWIAWRCHQGFLPVLLHPLAQALVLVIALNSWRLHALGRIPWKGRVYDGRAASG